MFPSTRNVNIKSTKSAEASALVKYLARVMHVKVTVVAHWFANRHLDLGFWLELLVMDKVAQEQMNLECIQEFQCSMTG